MRCVYQSGLKETTNHTDKKRNSSAPPPSLTSSPFIPLRRGTGGGNIFPRPLWEGLGEGAELLQKKQSIFEIDEHRKSVQSEKSVVSSGFYILNTIFPKFSLSSIFCWAAAASFNGNTLSTTGFNLPNSTRFSTSRSSFLLPK